MKTHLLTLYWFKQICLRAPLALMDRHFGANLQSGGGGGSATPPGAWIPLSGGSLRNAFLLLQACAMAT